MHLVDVLVLNLCFTDIDQTSFDQIFTTIPLILKFDRTHNTSVTHVRKQYYCYSQ